MRSQTPHLLFLLLLVIATFYHLPLTVATAADAVKSTTAIDPIATTFIRTSCATTLYPDLCYSSLSLYANTIQQKSSTLARIAIAVSLSKAHRVASYVFNLPLKENYSANSDTTSALRDCFNNLGDAMDNIRNSLNQMRQIVAGDVKGKELRFQMNSVQTWMSAALANEETCTNGFENVSEDAVKTDVCDRMTYVKRITSNALSIVNSYANIGMP